MNVPLTADFWYVTVSLRGKPPSWFEVTTILERANCAKIQMYEPGCARARIPQFWRDAKRKSRSVRITSDFGGETYEIKISKR